MMKRTSIRRAVAGLSLMAAVAGAVAFGGVGRVSASGDAVNCEATPSLCQIATTSDPGSGAGSVLSGIVAAFPTTMAPEREPYIDLAIMLAGRYPDGSPIILISNLGNKDAHQFRVLELSAAGERETIIPGLAAGQSAAYRDPAYPADCDRPAEIIINVKHDVPDSNAANDILHFTPLCGVAAS